MPGKQCRGAKLILKKILWNESGINFEMRSTWKNYKKSRKMRNWHSLSMAPFPRFKDYPGRFVSLRWPTLAVRRWQLFCRIPSRSDGFALEMSGYFRCRSDCDLTLCPRLFWNILAQVVDVDAEDTKRRSAEVGLQFFWSQSPSYLDFAHMACCSLSLSKSVSGFEHQPADS